MRGCLIQMHGSKVQSLVKNGSQTPLDSKAFIACYATQMLLEDRPCTVFIVLRGGVRGTRVWTCSHLNSWVSINEGGCLIEGGCLFQISCRKGALN